MSAEEAGVDVEMEGPTSSPCPVSASPKFIRLISSDDFEFFIERGRALSASSTLRNMFAGVDAIDGASKDVALKEFPSYIVYHLCRYFMYRSTYVNTTAEIPNFHIEPNVMVELLMAADFMDC